MAQVAAQGVPPAEPLYQAAEPLYQHRRRSGYVALSVNESDLPQHSSAGFFGACRQWWVLTTDAEYLASPASRRDLWFVLLPLLGLAMTLTTAATGSVSFKDTNLIILDVLLVTALLGAGWLPARNIFSDLAIGAISAVYLVAHRFLIHDDAALELCGLLAIFSLGCAGVHALVLAGLLAASTAAAASAAFLVEKARVWNPALLAVGLLALGLMGVVEQRVAGLFARSEAAASLSRSTTMTTGLGVAVASLRSEASSDFVVKDQAVGPDNSGMGTDNSSGEEDLNEDHYRAADKFSPSAMSRRQSLKSASGDSLGYSVSGGYPSTKSSPVDLAALRGSSPSDVTRPPLPGGRPHPSCGIVLINEVRTKDFSPLSEASLGLAEPTRKDRQRYGESRHNKGVQTTTTMGASVNVSMHADKETETTIAWATEGFYCRRCGLPPSLPKLLGKASLPRPVGGRMRSGDRSDGSGRSSRSRRSRSSGGSSSSDDRARAPDTTVTMVSAFAPISEETLSLSLEWAMKHWNLPRIPGVCCPWHTVISVAKRVIKYEVTSQCDPLWSPLTGWQCEHCTALNHKENNRCDMCFECNETPM